MNLNDFKDQNNIVDPNLRRRPQGSQEISENIIVDPNLKRAQKRIVTPQEMGFTHEENKIERPEQPILDRMELAIERKRNEARLMAEAIEESDGEGISEEEFQDLLKHQDFDDEFIPSENSFNG